ncbi:unnamed protein product [Cuscuta europaea]|uniref:Uncharacterized protein n=1 Tax=Cuscuta europaea TaxID=41803 RepID=A0A9P1ELZ1_CUSEU|nr:unnamed protein product [Cuscuta europaea]
MMVSPVDGLDFHISLTSLASNEGNDGDDEIGLTLVINMAYEKLEGSVSPLHLSFLFHLSFRSLIFHITLIEDIHHTIGVTSISANNTAQMNVLSLVSTNTLSRLSYSVFFLSIRCTILRLVWPTLLK